MKGLLGVLGAACLGMMAAGLAACGGASSNSGNSGGTPVSAQRAISGKVQGGQQPVSDSQITAWAAGDGTTDSTALACVMTDASGSFSFGTSASIACSGSLPTVINCDTGACSTSSQIYLMATGGNPGLAAGTNNSAIALMATLGPFSGISASTRVNISELTTAASVYALAPMLGTHTSSLAQRLAAASDLSGKSPWIDHSVARAQSLVDVPTSRPGTALPAKGTCTGSSNDPLNCEAEEKLDTLADALAACVNTAQPGSTACADLFCVATPGAGFDGQSCSAPALPQNVLQAALSVALNPGTVSANGIANLAGSTQPFAPVLSAAPNDWTLALNFSANGGTGVGGAVNSIAIDASGNVWVPNGNPDDSGNSSITILDSNGTQVLGSPLVFANLGGFYNVAIDPNDNVWLLNGIISGGVNELNSSGQMISPPQGYTGGGMNFPSAIAADAAGNIWISDSGDNSIVKLGSNGQPISPSGVGYTGGGLNVPVAIALDFNGNVWVVNNTENGSNSVYGVSELDNSGTPISPASGYTGGGLNYPQGVAIDPTGNVWVTDELGDSVTELSGSTGQPISASAYTGSGMNRPVGIAIDAGSNVWVTNINSNSSANGNSVSELSGNGSALSANGFVNAGLKDPSAVAIDASGNVWIASVGGVTELVGAAVPVASPRVGLPTSP